MPNELIVGAVKPLTGSAEKPADPKTGTFVTPSATAPAGAPQLFANPTLSFDSTLGLLVIEFRDPTGKVASSIPSQKQLEAYRLHEVPLPGQKAAEPAPTEGAAGTGPPVETAGAPAEPASGAPLSAVAVATAVRSGGTAPLPAAAPAAPGGASPGLGAASAAPSAVTASG
jgi:hypothetical protein